MSCAYVVGRITVTDPERWAEYRARVPGTLAPWAGELVFRGRQAELMAGEDPHPDIVVIRFPSLEAARGWHASPAYRALVPLRGRAADVVLAMYEA
jgi:uncharacterized protein (DUF1330 family)